MSGLFAIRNVDKNTRKYIQAYANEHDLTTSEALREIISLVQEHLAEKKEAKKYRSIFDTYDKLKFKSNDPHLSKNIDRLLYVDKQ